MISLIVATIDRVSELERFLCSLEDQSHRDFEVIVVDQNSDGRLSRLLRRHGRLTIRHLRSEPGLSRARNAGLRVASGDVIAIPDDDCWYPRDLLASVAGWFESHSGFDLLSTPVRTMENDSSGPNSPATSRRCTKSNVWRCAVSTSLFMRRSVATAVGGFDEGIGAGAASRYQSGEETDYVLRALENGFQMWFEFGFTVHHPSLNSIERLERTTYPFALGTGRILRVHGYALYEVGGHLIRSLGGAMVSLCQGDLTRARLYATRAAGQFVGYMRDPGSSNPTTLAG